MSTRKKANLNGTSTSIPNSPKDRGKRSEHEKLVALSCHYYAKNEFTSPLEPLVISAMETEQVKSEWVQFQSNQHSERERTVSDEGTTLSYDDLEDELMAEEDRFQWLPWSYMMRHIASLIAKGDTKALQEFALAQASYEEGLTKLTYKNRARLFLMVACEDLRSRERLREEIKKAEVRDLACKLWAKYNLRRIGRPQTAENIEYAVNSLPDVDWPLIFKEVGLHDLAEAKRGWNKKGNAKR